MEKELIPYEQALALKELGFDEPCMCFQYNKDSIVRFVNMSDPKFDNLLTYHRISTNPTLIWNDTEVVIPTFSQAFRWFRQEHGLYSHVRESYAFDNTLEFVTQINGSYVNHGISDKPINRFETYEEAELECLKKLIEIAKEKQNAGTI